MPATQEVTLYLRNGVYDGGYPSDVNHTNPALGGLLGDGDLITDDGDTSGMEVWNQDSADHCNIDIFIYDLDQLVLPAGWDWTGYRWEWVHRTGGVNTTQMSVSTADAGEMAYLGLDYATTATFSPVPLTLGTAFVAQTNPTPGSWFSPDGFPTDSNFRGAVLAGAKVPISGHEAAGIVDDYIHFTRFVLVCQLTQQGGGAQPYRVRQRLHPIAPARRWPREAWTGSSPRRVGGYR